MAAVKQEGGPEGRRKPSSQSVMWIFLKCCGAGLCDQADWMDVRHTHVQELCKIHREIIEAGWGLVAFE